MFKRFLFLIAVVAMGTTLAFSQQSTIRVNAPVTRPNDGKQMYVSYCATCHGLDGRGNGPTATALKVAPTDLTALSRNRHGSYPADHVTSVLQFGAPTSAHGTQNMPVWGPVLMQMDKVSDLNGQKDIETMRVSNIVLYIKTLQAK